MDAVAALHEFVRHWAMLNRLQPELLLGGADLAGHEALARDKLCFVLHGLTRAPDALVGKALSLPWHAVMQSRHRFSQRFGANPIVQASTEATVRLACADEACIAQLVMAIATHRMFDLANSTPLAITASRPA